MYMNVIEDLKARKDKPGMKPLVLAGVRQVGKRLHS